MKLKTQTTEGISERGLFLNDLKGGPFQLSGQWPASGSEEGMQARTDIAIALVKEGLLEYNNPGALAAFTVGNREIQLGPYLKKPGDSIKLTWLDDKRLEKELADVETV